MDADRKDKQFWEWLQKNCTLVEDMEADKKIKDYVKSVSCCFTGHRHLPIDKTELETELEKLIVLAVNNGYCNFICGGAMGFDTLAASIVLRLRKKYKNISLELAIPCLNQTKSWTDEQKAEYMKIAKEADFRTLLNETYTNDCMQKRNEYMVNSSSLVIAYFDGSNGGTKNTIDYAIKNNVAVKLLKCKL